MVQSPLLYYNAPAPCPAARSAALCLGVGVRLVRRQKGRPDLDGSGAEGQGRRAAATIGDPAGGDDRGAHRIGRRRHESDGPLDPRLYRPTGPRAPEPPRRGLESPPLARLPHPFQGHLVGAPKHAALTRGRFDLAPFWSGQSSPQIRHYRAAEFFDALVQRGERIVGIATPKSQNLHKFARFCGQQPGRKSDGPAALGFEIVRQNLSLLMCAQLC